MEFKIVHLDKTGSTNQWLREQGQGEMVVVADYQSAGKGQGTNSWESEPGKNLTLSILWHPKGVKANEQFVISMAVSNSIRRTLEHFLWPKPVVKWPNDIYIDHDKICGILIECQLAGDELKDCIVGIGLNVNQEDFVCDAPNPTSMALVEYKEFDREEVLRTLLEQFGEIVEAWDPEAIRAEYRAHLYRKEGEHLYRDDGGLFMARLTDVEDDGHLLLTDRTGLERRYAFKEVQFVL